MLESEYKPWIFFKNTLEKLFPNDVIDYDLFRQFKPRFIWNRDTQKLERCVKVGDVGKYITDRLKDGID